MQSRFNFRSPLTLFLTGVILFAVFGALWWQNVYQNPQRVFEATLANNLSTNYVTKNELTSSTGYASLQQISLQLGKDNVARSLVTVRSSSSTVTTESLGKKDAAYIRYVNIAEAKKTKDYSGVTNIWAKSDTKAQNTLAKLFTQSLLDVTAAPVPPIGNVPAATRAELLRYMHDEEIYTPDYSKVRSEVINGRKAYVYTVSVKLAPYLRLMQEFSHVYGLKDLDSITPSDYQSAKAIELTMASDVLSHQMVRVSLASSGFNETYTDYGVARSIEIPKKTVSTTELRNLLNKQQ